MAQVSDVNIAADPSGLAMRAEINNIFNALNSLNKGASRPASLTAGSMWVDDTNDPDWLVYFYDGSNDLEVFQVDSDAHTFTISPALTLDTNPGLEYNGSALRVKADNTLIARTANGIQIKDQTIGRILGYGASGVASAIAAGYDKQVLRNTGTLSSPNAPAFARHGGDLGDFIGAYNFASAPSTNGFISHGAGSAIASQNFPLLTLVGTGLEVATDGASISLAVSTDVGSLSTYETSGYDYHVGNTDSGSASYAGVASASAASIPLADGVGNAAPESFNFIAHIWKPTDGSHYYEVSGHTVFRDAAGELSGGSFIGGIQTTTAVTFTGIITDGGNIDGGFMAMYGNMDIFASS